MKTLLMLIGYYALLFVVLYLIALWIGRLYDWQGRHPNRKGWRHTFSSHRDEP